MYLVSDQIPLDHFVSLDPPLLSNIISAFAFAQCEQEIEELDFHSNNDTSLCPTISLHHISLLYMREKKFLKDTICV